MPALAWFPRVPLARERHIYTLGLWLASMRLRSAWTVPSPIRALLLGGAFNYTARRLIPTPTAASSTRACLAVTERHISDCCNDWPAPRVRELLFAFFIVRRPFPGSVRTYTLDEVLLVSGRNETNTGRPKYEVRCFFANSVKRIFEIRDALYIGCKRCYFSVSETRCWHT